MNRHRPLADEVLMRVAVLGAGGVGGFLAAALTRAGNDVIVIARDATVAAVESEGLTVSSSVLGELHEHPRAATEAARRRRRRCSSRQGDRSARGAARIHAEPPLVVPLLNGIDHLAVLRERFGDAVVAARSDRGDPHGPT